MDIPKSRFSYHDYQTWLTVVIFIITWIQIAKVPLPKPLSVLTTVGRTLSVLLSSSILVLTNVITPDEAFAAQRPETLILLAGLMVLLGKFEEKGIIMMVRKLLCNDLHE
ncbi:hypothetical protein BKA69DRAFT_27518 [Paraphysoderma sedebokerense]|nr:hypothetical protein BKA69DRAFT_27518 [Paraphysoderma sedebokerense]